MDDTKVKKLEERCNGDSKVLIVSNILYQDRFVHRITADLHACFAGLNKRWLEAPFNFKRNTLFRWRDSNQRNRSIFIPEHRHQKSNPAGRLTHSRDCHQKRRDGWKGGLAYRPRCQIELLFTADGREISNAWSCVYSYTFVIHACMRRRSLRVRIRVDMCESARTVHRYTYEHGRHMMRVGRGA